MSDERPGGDMRRRELGPEKPRLSKGRVNPYLLTFEKAPGWGDSRVVKKIEKAEPIKKKPSAADAFEAASRRASKQPRRKKPQKKKREEKLKDETVHFIDERISIKDVGADGPLKVNGDEVFLSTLEMAKATGRHESSFKRWIEKPWFPKKVAGVWRKTEVLRAIEENTRKFKKRNKAKAKPKVGSFFSPPKNKGSLDRLCKLYELKVELTRFMRSASEEDRDTSYAMIDDLIADEKGLLKS